jgi:hypothetical protein
MSSLYIHSENQEMLWNLIHKLPQIQQMESSQKRVWFKSVIQTFHEMSPNIRSYGDLKTINSKTLLYMKEQILRPQLQPQKQIPIEGIASRDLQENKTEMYSTQFNEKKKEYEKMLENPLPTVEFPTTKDEPIKNIDDLIQQHLAERKLDIPHGNDFSPTTT